MSNQPRCLNPACPDGEGRYARGLCRKCYNLAWSLVQEGLVTWDDLQARGKCLPKITGKRGRASWFLPPLEGIKKDSNGD